LFRVLDRRTLPADGRESEMEESALLVGMGLLFGLAFAGALWQHGLGPRRRRAAFRAEMRLRGYAPVDFDSSGVRALLAVARPGPLEWESEDRSRERTGLLAVEFDHRVTESGFSAEAYRIEARDAPVRLIALVSWTHQRDTRAGPSAQRRRVRYEKLWVGEVVALPVPERVVAYDFMQAAFSEGMRGLAEARDVTPKGRLSAPSEVRLARDARSLMDQDGLGSELRGQLVLSPTGWVLDAPQSRALGRLTRVLELAERISRGLTPRDRAR